jgi:hypothetical protein
MSERDREAPLAPEDIRSILAACSPDSLLVGGQALAFWAEHLAVRLPDALVSGVTADADFIGGASTAAILSKRLGWKLWLPRPDDATPQTAKVTHRLKNGTVKQVDFLSGVVGIETRNLQRRAVELEVPGVGRLRVIHPLDVLLSRIQNLHKLPEKRGAAGVAQARLAVNVLRAFVVHEIHARGERVGLKILERIADMAAGAEAVTVFHDFGIDPLRAVPLEEFQTTSSLHQSRWPQILANVTDKRTKRLRARQRRGRAASRNS